MTGRVEAYVLTDEGDERGRAWQLGRGVDFLAGIEDVHLMTLEPGCIRGNHFHRHKHEILIIEHEGTWALFWDDGPGETPQERRFDAAGMVAVLVPPNCAHAVENCGGGTMRIVAICDRPYDSAHPDADRRVLREVD